LRTDKNTSVLVNSSLAVGMKMTERFILSCTVPRTFWTHFFTARVTINHNVLL